MGLGCESGKQWAFVTFAQHSQARQCKEQSDRQLVLPGAPGPVEVMFARNQGKNGQDPIQSTQGQVVPPRGQVVPPLFPGQPPPPNHAPNHGWTTYFTQAGLPYYHNHMTGVTQWECPV